MPNLSFYEKQHVQQLIQQEGSLKLIFDHFTRRIGKIMERWSDSGSNDVWVKNAALEKEVEKELAELRARIIKNIDDFSIDAWNRSNQKTDDLITGFVKDLPINKTLKDGLFTRNNEALKAFHNRKIDNLTISDRVWKATGTAKENIEYYLGSGLSVGRSANLISQDMRQLLANPDKRFHRINAEGKLVPSAPMKAYHPGQGVYRSSFMNAKRLAVTNTNESYRTADSERWNRLDFVLGIEVRRSSSAKGACPICDPLTGKYPKDFKYWGWHPFCICVAIPILMSEDDFMNYLTDGSLPKGSVINDLPAEARAFMQEKLDSGKVTLKSHLFADNQKYFNGGLRGKSHEELSKIFIEERNKNKRIEFMSPLTVESISKSTVVLINNGKTGCIVAPDGDLQNLFNNAGKGQGAKVVNIAIENGAKKLDCFDGYLTKYYKQFGFKETERIKWDDKYAPKNWNYEKNGRPDIVYMEL